MIAALPLAAAVGLFGNGPVVALSGSLPKAVIKLAELQVELLFTDHFTLALQGGIGRPTFDRNGAKDLTLTVWDTGLQLRGYFLGDSGKGGMFAGAAGQYLRSDDVLTVQVAGGGAVVGYKWAWKLGPFIDLNGGAGYGYLSAVNTEGKDAAESIVFPFLNLNVGWAI